MEISRREKRQGRFPVERLKKNIFNRTRVTYVTSKSTEKL